MQWPYNLDFGDVVGVGATAIVARLDAVVKLATPHNLDRIEREKRVYERLGFHPRVLRYYGTTVGGILRLTLDLRLRWAVQLTEAIQFLHSKAVLHGDISCNNTFLDENLDVKIGDCAGSPIDHEDPLVCYETRYDDPASERTSVASEIFALGSTFYEIMTGSRPYESLTDDAVERAFTRKEFPSVTPLDACGCVIQKCWTKAYDNLEVILGDLNAECTLRNPSV